jgi:PAS domain S-box-containing protein
MPGLYPADRAPHVLVIQVRPDLGQLVSEALGQDYRITVHHSDIGSIERACADAPDAIILDCAQAETTEPILVALRSDVVLHDIPVLTVSEEDDPESRCAMLRKGVVDCLSKPFCARHLRARVEGILSQRVRARARFRHTEERYRTLFRSIDEGFCIVKMIFDDAGIPVDYLFLEVNPSFERQTGLHGAQGRRMRELAPAHEVHWFHIYGQIAMSGEPARFEQPARELGRWFDVYAFRYGDPGDRMVAILFNDVTQRKLSELRVAETKAMLRTAMRLGRLGAWHFDVAGSELHLSPEARVILGVGDGFPSSLDVFAELFDAPSRDLFHASLGSCIAGGAPFDLELPAHAADGESMWLRLIGEPVRGAGGATTRILGAVQDVTEIRASVAQANALGERLSSTLERMADAFITLDRQWRFTYVNGKAERSLRRSRDELLGRVVWEEFPEAVGTVFQEQYERALAEMTTTEFETYYPPLSAWLKVTAHPSPDGLAIHFHDVTATRQVRAALDDKEKQYRMLFETSQDAILRVSAAGTIARANPAACAMFGRSEADLCARPCCDLAPAEDPRIVSYLAEGRASARADLTLVRADGSRFEGEVTCSTYCSSSGDAWSYLAIRDVTDRVNYRRKLLQLNSELAERVRQRTADLELANSELRAFAHSLAHDLRSPIAAISGFAEMLRQSLPGLLPERSIHYLNRIREAATRMDEYTNGLLTLAQVAQKPMSVALVDLSRLARDIVGHLQAEHPGRRARVHIQDSLEVLGDAPLLRMALENLIGNAWKFSSRAEAAEISFYALPDGKDGLSYCVEDNGAGFDMAHADKLFGSFQRLHSQAEFPGTGIGLTNAERIVRRHGGRIWAESEPGRGARFFFTLQ